MRISTGCDSTALLSAGSDNKSYSVRIPTGLFDRIPMMELVLALRILAMACASDVAGLQLNTVPGDNMPTVKPNDRSSAGVGRII